MSQLRCLIVEDEPLAAKVLQQYIGQVPFLDLAGTCKDAIYAMEFLSKENIDIVFLDIHLPKLKGLDFVKTLDNPPVIIITTAYHQYAIESFSLNVCDYLLKPIEFERFLAAVQKAQKSISGISDKLVKQTDEAGKGFLFFNSNKKKVKIYFENIIYIESLREYIRVVTESKNIVTKMSTNEIEELLPKDKFIRVHRSFIVSIDKVESFSATEVEVANKQIPLGRSYKDDLFELFEK